MPNPASEEPSARTRYPAGLTQRNVEPPRERRRRVGRYVFLGALAAILLAALADSVGQRPSTTVAGSDTAQLIVYSPSRLRGGLLFTTRFEIRARQMLRAATLVLDPGWFEGMQVNSIVPQPRSEASHDGRVLLHLGLIPAGDRMVMFMQFQVNPTNVGRRSQDVRLLDGSQQLAEIQRHVTIFP